MLPDWTIIAFTGHRKLAQPPVVSGAISTALDLIAARSPTLAAVSSAASGSDTLFLEELEKRNTPFSLLLPFARERFKQDFDDSEWERVQRLFSKALSIEELERTETNEEAYLETSRRTIDRADVLIAVLDAAHEHKKAGTRDAVDYAERLGKPIIVVDPNTGTIQQSRMDLLPARNGAQLSGDPRQAVEGYFKHVSALANHVGPQARQLVRWIILLHLISTALALAVLVFDSLMTKRPSGHLIVHTVDALELVCLGSALYLMFRHHRLHGDWLSNRVRAELCRSALATWGLRHHPGFDPRLAIPGFERLIQSLRIARLMDRGPMQRLDDLCKAYREKRVQGQINYFQSKGETSRLAYHWRRRLATSATIAAVICNVAGAALILSALVRGQDLSYLLIRFFALVLPLVNAAVFTVIISQDHSRRFVRYPQMAALLQRMDRRLSGQMTCLSLAGIMNETEQLLLQEVVEWYSFARFAGETH